jgi:2-(1,2-epoxy-1,2-dihydrophenyl)acetyl-CoA isomerase
MYDFIKYTQNEGVATVTLNRPDVYNALNDEITYDLQDVFKKIAKEDSVRVVILTGEGKAFCAGQDLKAAIGEEKRSFSDSLHKRYNPLIKLIRGLKKPIIGRINGVAAGAGCSIALACDLLVMADEAYLVEVFVNIGLVLDSGSSYFLPRVVGNTKAFELSTMGSKVGGQEAVTLGIANKSVPLAELDEVVAEYTDYYSSAPTKSIGLIKQMLNKSGNANLNDMLDYEAYCQDIAGSSMDYKEGVNAFLEKRKAKFTGK